MPTYAVRQLHVPQARALLANGIGLLVLLILAPAFGALSDRVGRRPLLLGSAIAIIVLTYPSLAMLTSSPSPLSLTLFQVVFAILIAAFTGTAPAAMSEIYPPEVRSTGVSIAYNSAVTIFGGFAPFIATWLIAETGYSLAPAFYVTAAMALSVVTIWALFRPSKEGEQLGVQ